MSKREYINRYSIIINFLQRGQAQWKDILNHLKSQSEIHGYNFVVSQRTFQRDISEIRSIYDIDIQNNKTKGAYFIAEEENHSNSAQLLDSFNLYSALSLSNNYFNYIQFESRVPQGTEHIYGLLHAIKNKLHIEIKYYRFYEKEAETVEVQPYLIKQFKGRWYLLGIKTEIKQLRTYALDRIKNFDITKKRFETSKHIDLKNYFNHAFGIITPEDDKPQKITFALNQFQAKYFKSYPLHQTQRIVKENEDGVIFEVTVFITHDLIMELLSHSHEMKILSPKSLVKEMKQIHDKALRRLT